MKFSQWFKKPFFCILFSLCCVAIAGPLLNIGLAHTAPNQDRANAIINALDSYLTSIGQTIQRLDFWEVTAKYSDGWQQAAIVIGTDGQKPKLGDITPDQMKAPLMVSGDYQLGSCYYSPPQTLHLWLNTIWYWPSTGEVDHIDSTPFDLNLSNGGQMCV